MLSKERNLVLSLLMIVTLFVPTLSGHGPVSVVPATNTATPVTGSIGPIEPSITATPRTLEAIVSYVDPWGGVSYSFISVQNASHYGHRNEVDLPSMVEKQAETEDGYVSEAGIALLSQTPYPSCVIGGPSAVLQLVVNPVIVVPSDETESYVADLDLNEALSLADDYKREIEDGLSFNFQKVSVSIDNRTEAFSYRMANMIFTISYYRIVYVDLLEEVEKGAAYEKMVSLLHSRGGFMSLVNGTSLEERKYVLMSVTKYYDKSSPQLFMNGIGMGSNFSILRVGTEVAVESTVVSQASYFDVYYDVTLDVDSSMLSLTEFTGYTGEIHNMMADNSSAPSISLIMAVAPDNVALQGVPEDWWMIDDSSHEVGIPTFGEGGTIPPNTTAFDAFIKISSMLPRMAALQADGLLGIVDPNQVHPSLEQLLAMQYQPILEVGMENQSFIMNFDWGLSLFERYVHMEEVSFGMLPMEEVSFNTLPLEEVSFNMLSRIMEEAGVNPLSLVDNMGTDLTPGGILTAFLRHFDSYCILDDYPNITARAWYRDTFEDSFGGGLNATIAGGAPSSFTTKQDVLTFLRSHWNETLKNLWETVALMIGVRVPGQLTTAQTEEASTLYAELRGTIHQMLTLSNLPGYLEPLGYDIKEMKPASVLPSDLSFIVTGNINGSDEELNKALDKSSPLLFKALSLNQTFSLTTGVDHDCDIVVEKAPMTGPAIAGAMVERTITVHNVGTLTAYSLRVYDSRTCDHRREIEAGLSPSEQPFVWTRDSLAPGATWTIRYNYTPSKADSGATDEAYPDYIIRKYMDFPVVCVYCRQIHGIPGCAFAVGSEGDVFYTMSNSHVEFEVSSGGEGGIIDWLTNSFLGVPNFIFVSAGGAAAAVVVVLLVKKKK